MIRRRDMTKKKGDYKFKHVEKALLCRGVASLASDRISRVLIKRRSRVIVRDSVSQVKIKVSPRASIESAKVH